MVTNKPASRALPLAAAVVTLCILLEGGLGHPPADSHLTADSSIKHLRTKRCSCSNWMDKECVYFCHLDIIWINTPGHSTPYGLGNMQKRQKRSFRRCECSHSNDRICVTFCRGKIRSLRNPQVPMNIGMLTKLLHSGGSKQPKLNW